MDVEKNGSTKELYIIEYGVNKMEYYRIGSIANTHGINGHIKVFPTTDDLSRYELLKTVYIGKEDGTKEVYTIKTVKYHKNMVLLKLGEVQDMNQALLLKGREIFITEEDLLPLEENENYVFDLIGLMAIDENGVEHGKVKDVIFTGSNDVYVIDNGTKNGLLLPATKECVVDVNVEEGYMKIHILEGLLDL